MRFLCADKVSEFETFLQTVAARDFIARRQLAATRRLAQSEVAALQKEIELQPLLAGFASGAVYEHEHVGFVTYPYEWAPEMLWEAGRLTLELGRESLAEGYGLKDATPYNVLFRSAEPVFIDLLSFEPRAPGDPVWRPYGQFVRTFLLPLLVCREWGGRLADIFTTRRDGLQPEEVYKFCGWLQRFRQPIFSFVSMPTWLSGRARAEGTQLFRPRELANSEKARFIVESLFKQLQRGLDATKPTPQRSSLWSDYMNTHSYNASAFAAKERFVEEVLHEFKPTKVLDVGANTGHFSILAAQAGAEVVAIDYDATCIGSIWQRAQARHFNILPLVMDLSRPSPAVGWRNGECRSFLERASQAFDCVLMLAVIHHLLVTERIPLSEILTLAAELTTSLLVIEFVSPQDEMFQQLARGREHLHASLNETLFEAALRPHFDVLRSLALPGGKRKLYALKRKGSGV